MLLALDMLWFRVVCEFAECCFQIRFDFIRVSFAFFWLGVIRQEIGDGWLSPADLDALRLRDGQLQRSQPGGLSALLVEPCVEICGALCRM